MGKRRGRRTRSDERSGANRQGGAELGWPGLTGPSTFTAEGRIAQLGAISRNLAHAPGFRGASARFLLLMVFPPLAIASLVRDLARAVNNRLAWRRARRT